MANKNTLEIIIKANATQAVSALNKLQATVAKPFTGLQQQVGALGNAFTSVTGISLGAAGAFAALGLAASKASDFIKSSVSETVAYAQSVRELSYVLGTNAEETSRLIQVADDYLISVDKLSTALRFAVKNGFEPTVESLAQLADQFNAIQDPNERAAKMVEIFGRNWTALVPLLKAGGDAIRENAAAIQEGLILDDLDTTAAFEYQQALDQLNDTVMALKTSIGMELIPVLADVANEFNRVIGTATAMDAAFRAGILTDKEIVDIVNQVEEAGGSAAEVFKALSEAQAAAAPRAKELAQIMIFTGNAVHDVAAHTGDLTSAQQDAADAAAELAEKEKRAGDALKDYAKVITKLGMTTAEENALMEQFAANLGGIDSTALIAANDMDLLDAAMAANAITLQEYTAISLVAAQGTGELDDKTRAYLETQLGVTNALEGTANAATKVRDQLINVIGLAGQLRGAGPREVRNIVLDQLTDFLKNVDPAKAAEVAKGIEDIGLAFGVFNKNDLAQAEAIPAFVALLSKGITEGLIPPDMASELVQGLLDQIRDLESKGIPLDLSKLFKPYFGASDMARGNTGGTTNPLLEQLMPTESDIQAVTDEYAKVPEAIQTAITEPMAALNLGESVALPVEQVATAVGTLGENAATAQVPMTETAKATGVFYTNAVNLNTILETLPSRIEILGKKATGAYQPMRDLATAIGDVSRAAQSATMFVTTLAGAIAALKDKKITITANVVLNDPLGIFGQTGGPNGGPNLFKIFGGYQFAKGGKPRVGKTALVGEEGPELFIPQTAGTIIPADVTQAAIIAAATMGDAFGGNRGKTPSERAKNRRRTDTPAPSAPSGPVVSGYVPQPTPPQFMGANFDAYMELFQPPFSVDTPTPAPEPTRRAARSSDQGGSTRFPSRNRSEPMTSGQQRRQQQALQQALEQTYQPLGSSLFQPSSQGQGELSTQDAAVATSATETERLGKNVTYNNYFPVQKLEDELDARDLARKVAAELARMPSR